MSRNIAVTGASGRIGRYLVMRLLEEGFSVRVLLHRSHVDWPDIQPAVVRGSLNDPEALDSLVKDCDVVFHLAAEISVRSRAKRHLDKTNLFGTENVLEAARRQKVRRVVYFSSVQAFVSEGRETPISESTPLALNSASPYGRSKAIALERALIFSRERNPEVIALCPTGVIGPYDFAPSPSGKMLIDLFNGNLPALTPGGFDWVDVRDVCDAAIAAINSGRNGEAYILSGKYARIWDIANLTSVLTGRKVPKFTIPFSVLLPVAMLAEPATGLLRKEPVFTPEALRILKHGSQYISHEKAAQAFGFSPRPLKTTIADACRWFEQNGYL